MIRMLNYDKKYFLLLGRKDDTLLNAERMVYISSVINDFKKHVVFC